MGKKFSPFSKGKDILDLDLDMDLTMGETPLKTGFGKATGESVIQDGVDSIMGKGKKGVIRTGNENLKKAKIPFRDKDQFDDFNFGY